jgi:two-component system chemotaxis response regulator CheB
MAGPFRVLVVDDSRIFRQAVANALEGQEDIDIVGSVYSGEKALEFLRMHRVDLVTLDVEMPGMDGLATLREIQKLNNARTGSPPTGVLMLSAHTRERADVTIQALQAGAFDFIPKPTLPSPEANQLWLSNQLLSKIRAFRNPSALPEDRPVMTAVRNTGVKKPVEVVLIAVSTGGPLALTQLLPELVSRITLPVLIVQHMPSGDNWIRSLADQLSRTCGADVVEAIDAQPLRPRTYYLAPGGRHLILRRIGGHLTTGLLETPPENLCRPSANLLFRSAAAEASGAAIAVVMTGMGCDGTAGLAVLKRAGGYAIAQDEASSTVWGMPRSIVEAGLADTVVPLGRIADTVAREIRQRQGN